jgi:predicted transposase/invertase (TIGR01784 family)
MRADPKVDYAFKRVYGIERNADILVHLLNAILRPEVPIRTVEILNPFSEKDFAEDKLNVLDVRARDDSGRLFDVEIQLLLPTHFKGRILHYWAGMFHEQLRDGESYANLRPAISICIVNQSLFPAADDYHLAFELVDVVHGERFTDLMQVHVLQLPIMQPTNWKMTWRHGYTYSGIPNRLTWTICRHDLITRSFGARSRSWRC